MRKSQGPEYYALVRKAYVRTWFISTIVLIIAIIASFQYTNYVDRRSNTLLCDLARTQDAVYTDAPPSTQTGRKMAVAINRVANSKECNR